MHPPHLDPRLIRAQAIFVRARNIPRCCAPHAASTTSHTPPRPRAIARPTRARFFNTHTYMHTRALFADAVSCSAASRSGPPPYLYRVQCTCIFGVNLGLRVLFGCFLSLPLSGVCPLGPVLLPAWSGRGHCRCRSVIGGSRKSSTCPCARSRWARSPCGLHYRQACARTSVRTFLRYIASASVRPTCRPQLPCPRASHACRALNTVSLLHTPTSRSSQAIFTPRARNSGL